ncbi:MAG: hypothetical protein HY096_01685 [Nitrospinae bacterium]|nr:hypothetical protein [Nitrospinota bacterium]
MSLHNISKAIKKFFRKFNALNIILLILCSVLTITFVKIWFKSDIPKNKENIKVAKVDINPIVEVSSNTPPPVSVYESIPQKNLFRPNRKEWELPPPPPPPPPSPPPPSPPPDLKLHGVIILGGDKNIALMSGSYVSGTTKVEMKTQRFRINQIIADYRITDIMETKTILKKEGGEEVLTIPLMRGGIRTDLLASIKNISFTPDTDKRKEPEIINLGQVSASRTALLQPSDNGVINLSRLEPKFSISDAQPLAGQSIPQHISGAVTPPPLPTIAGGIDTIQQPQHISGSLTNVPSTIVTSQGIGPPPTPPQQHISGSVTGR